MSSQVNLSEILEDPDLCGAFTITRNPGMFGAGGWEPGSVQMINAFGAVRNATQEDMRIVPEGDRVEQMISIRSVFEMHVTSEDLGITADIITWLGVKFRVVARKIYAEQGYTFAVASRMQGS